MRLTHTHTLHAAVYHILCMCSLVPRLQKGGSGVEGESGNKTNAYVEIFEKSIKLAMPIISSVQILALHDTSGSVVHVSHNPTFMCYHKCIP